MAAPILKYQNIVVSVTTVSTQFFFPDQPNLRNARIVGIEAQDGYNLPICSDLSTPNVGQTTFQNAFITLVVGDVNNITRMPLINLQTVWGNFNSGAGIGQVNFNPRDFQVLTIYWNKSYIEVPAADAPTPGSGFNFGVYYYDPIKR